MICEGIEPVAVGACDSVDGIRTAARNRKAASTAVAAGNTANEYLADADFTAALARLEAPEGVSLADSETVVAPRFGSPLRVSSQTSEIEQDIGVPEGFLKNMETHLRSLERVREVEQPAMTMVAGSSGVGKTQVVKTFCFTPGYDGFYVQAARGEGTGWNFAKSLSRILRTVPHYNTHAEARMLFASYLGPGLPKKCVAF
ncbi:MAG: hypothetical protein HRU33_20025 [Rhodobacteraceae bacterium]|nr:hypothetical protein [Paracoccaceae bacterium]